MIDLRLGDCMEYMPSFNDKSFDLAIVDPPYSIGAGTMTMGRGSRNDTGKNKAKNWDEKIPDDSYFSELKRVSKNQIIWGGNYYNLGPTRCYLIWDKLDYNSDFASAELAWTSFDSVVKTFERARNKGDEVKIHPTQKPVSLYLWILKSYAKSGFKILDTHSGSASLAVACHRMGFDYTGFEIDPEYYGDAKKRLDHEISQVRMF